LLFLLLFAAPSAGADEARIRMSTTTSTEASGLLDVLLPAFEKRSGIRVEVIAVGSGKALKLGENGDVDVVLSHAPELEEAFVRDGFGVNRRDLMYNDFVIVGPVEDPAALRGSGGAAAALAKLAASARTFVSRGDESGTHQKEKEIWKKAGVEPRGAWYVVAGLGMGEVLLLADDRRAYTLTDRGTYLAFRERLELAVLVEGDPALFNPYTVMAVNPKRHPHVNHAAAMRLISWLTSPEGQKRIGGFTKKGRRFFHPNASGRPVP